MPRGFRLNNPCNLRQGQGRFIGEYDKSRDNEFRQFRTMYYGMRAALHLLMKTYYHLHHLRTIKEIIHRWAPPEENNTSAYVKFISKKTGVGENDIIPNKPEFWVDFLDAMIQMENGEKIDRVFIKYVVDVNFQLFRC